MLSRARTAAVVCVLLLAVPFLVAKYKIKEYEVRAPVEYSAHQAFQNLVVGAYPCNTQAKANELFDTDKLIEKGLMPVLIVVQNDGVFPVQIYERDIFLIDQEGHRNQPIPYTDVLLEINSKKSKSNMPNIKDLQKLVKREMLLDFEHKAFGEKMIAPGSTDHGVVFYRLPADGKLEGCRMYLPEIVNVTNNERLMFFEFDLP
ncbi:MAG: hypothetical protein WAO20_11745 [Acidobacteriota bacterium]